MLVLLLFLITHEIDLGYNIKYHVADLSEREIVEMEVKKIEAEANAALHKKGKATIGNAEIELREKWTYPFGPVELKLLSYVSKGDEIEARVRLEIVKGARLKTNLKGNTIVLRFKK